MIMTLIPKTIILTLLLAALASAGAGAQVSVSPASLEWASASMGEEAVYVSVSGPWTAEIYPDTGHFTLDSAEGEDSDFIHVAPSSANALTTAVSATLTVRDASGGFAAVSLLHLAASSAPDTPSQPDTAERLGIDGNWTLRRTFTSSSGEVFREEINFYDGLGYPEQTVRVGAGAVSGRNIVQPVWYDAMRRSDTRVYLPYVSPENSGRTEEPVSGAFAAQAAWYSSAGYPSADAAYAYRETVREASPLGRVTAEHREGSDYALESPTGGRSSSIRYGANVADEVRLLRADGTGGALTISGYYPAGTLLRTERVGESGDSSVVWSDNLGRTVLERTATGAMPLDTYHVYDASGRETWTVLPEGSALLADGLWTAPSLSDGEGATPAALHCTVRTYDASGNVLERKLPGREGEEYVYDASGRLTMERTGLDRAAGVWKTYRRDALGRVVERSLLRSAASGEHFRTLFDSSSCPSEVYPAASSSSSSSSTATLLEQVVYGAAGRSLAAAAGLTFAEAAGVTSGDLCPERVTGLVTYSRLAVLPPGSGYGAVDGYLQRACYYDSLGRLIQTVEKTPDGVLSRRSVGYGFSGEILTEEESHGSDTKTSHFTYDSWGRPLSETVSVNGGPEAAVTRAYDDLGRQVSEGFGGTQEAGSAVVLTDSRDIRGILTARSAVRGGGSSSSSGGSGTAVFSMSLRRADAHRATPRWDGRISEWEWTQGSASSVSYAFSYDAAGRLTDSRRYAGGASSSSSAESAAYSERGITYDRNGSLLTLSRYGESALLPETTLSCSYSGVRRTGWSYDADGNVTSGPYGGRSVSYNLLDLPSGISGGGVSGTAGYGWLADGTKCSAVGAQSGSGRDYRGTFVYGADGTLESVAFSGGRIHRGQTGLMDDVRYHVCDHLGSVRAVVSSAGEVLERSDYYPYGGRIGVGADGEGNRWRYGGKEEQGGVTGLGLLDFGARFYSPAAVSWTAQDPLSEKYPALTPYLFCAADPVNLADPDGRKVWVTANGNGTYTVQGGELDEDLGIYLSRPDGAGGWASTGVAIGKSLFSTSFYNTDTKSWCVGAIINPNDMSGIDFMNNTIKPIAHRLGHYMHNATGGKIYDFKLTNGVALEIDENGKTITIVRDPRRGMPYGGDGIYASARDIGNIAAGYVAGYNGFGWANSRIAFDLLQTLDEIISHIGSPNFKLRFVTEGLTTQNAQKYGWKRGFQIYYEELINSYIY
jgi:RHS repeat-associated protein